MPGRRMPAWTRARTPGTPGSRDRRGFALYVGNIGRYEDTVVLADTPEDALDWSCGLYLGVLATARLARGEDLAAAVDIWRQASTARGRPQTEQRVARVKDKLADPDAFVLVASAALSCSDWLWPNRDVTRTAAERGWKSCATSSWFSSTPTTGRRRRGKGSTPPGMDRCKEGPGATPLPTRRLHSHRTRLPARQRGASAAFRRPLFSPPEINAVLHQSCAGSAKDDGASGQQDTCLG